MRTVGQGDLLALARLWRSMRLEEAGSRDPETGADLSPFYALADRRSREPATILLIAYRGEEAVGFYCGRVQGRVGRGIDLYVRPAARRRGVGRRLVAAALAEYRQRGADRIVERLDGASVAPAGHQVGSGGGVADEVDHSGQGQPAGQSNA